MSKKNRIFWLVSIASLVFALGITAVINGFLNERIAIIGSWVGLQLSFNDGIAFGVNLGILQPILIGIAILLVIWIALKSTYSTLDKIGFGLIVGGGVANIADRLHDGFVTDYFQIGSFPIFNVADSFISIGVCFLLINMIKRQNL